MAEPWLEAGLALLEHETLGFERDCFVRLPNRDLSGSCGRQAQYSDALGFPRDSLKRLQCPDGHALHLPNAALFWTERSERAGCSSWLAAFGVVRLIFN